MVQRPEDDSSEGDVQKPPHPFPVEASAMLNVTENIAMFQDADRTT